MPAVLRRFEDDPDRAADEAADRLRRGGLVVIPTETVFGLAVRADDAAAVERLYEAKNRPAQKALALHLAAASDLARWCVLSDGAARLRDAFLPGPLMLLLEPSAAVPPVILGGSRRVGVRVPDHPAARAILERCEFAVAATSANLSGRPSPTVLDDVLHDLGDRVDLIVASVRAPAGLASTIVDVASDPPRLLRVGSIAREQVEAVLGVAIL